MPVLLYGETWQRGHYLISLSLFANEIWSRPCQHFKHGNKAILSIPITSSVWGDGLTLKLRRPALFVRVNYCCQAWPAVGCLIITPKVTGSGTAVESHAGKKVCSSPPSALLARLEKD